MKHPTDEPTPSASRESMTMHGLGGETLEGSGFELEQPDHSVEQEVTDGSQQ